MRALVTGCAGFIGSHLTDSLLADGHEVVGVDAFTDNYARAVKLRNLVRAVDFDGFRLVRADLTEAELEPLLEGCDVVFHLAAEPGVRESFGPRRPAYLRNNVQATRRLVEAASEVPRLVLASSSSVYGDAELLPTPERMARRPRSPYAETKALAEDLWRATADRGVVLRFFTVYGPRQRPDMAFSRFCEAAHAGTPIELYGRRTRDFTYVADVISALRLAAEVAEAGGTVLNVGGGSPASLEDVVDLLRELAGRRLSVRRAGEQRGDARATLADTTAIRALLGWQPQTTLQAGLTAQWEYRTSSLPLAA
jgi:UDP-glucuronate 4-epimerase